MFTANQKSYLRGPFPGLGWHMLAASLERVKAGPARTQAKLEKACYVDKAITASMAFPDSRVLLRARIGGPKQRFIVVTGVR